MNKTDKIDKLLLATHNFGVTWLRYHKGVGPVMLRAAVADGLVTSRYERSGRGTHHPQDHRIELTDAGKARCKELLTEQDCAAAKIADECAAAMGPCGLCGAVAKQRPYGSWRVASQISWQVQDQVEGQIQQRLRRQLTTGST